MSGSKKKRKCNNCGRKHFPPTGSKCPYVQEKFDWPGSEEEDGLSAGWATDAYSHGSPTRSRKDYSWNTATKLHDHLTQVPWRPPSPSWPPLRPPQTNWVCADDSRHLQGGGDRENGVVERPPPFPRAPPKDNFQSQLDDLQTKIAQISADKRESKDKISNIEKLLEKAIAGPKFDGKQITPPATRVPLPVPDQYKMAVPDKHPRHGGPDNARYSRPEDRFSDFSNQESSTDSSPDKSKRESIRKKGSRRHSKGNSKHNFDFDFSRFLPQEEQDKPMNTDRLWFCHGALMMEAYKQGKNIEGMLAHNLFVAEKAASRAYLSSGIVKYDEGVRGKATDIGIGAYSAGDMSLALRFLSTEYARPKNNQNQNNYGQRQGIRRQTYSQALSGYPRDRDSRNSKVYCWLFNGNGCHYDNCRYPHVCSRCLISGHNQHNCRQYYNPQVPNQNQSSMS